MPQKKRIKILGTASGGLRRRGRNVDHLDYDGETRPKKKAAKKKAAKKKK